MIQADLTPALRIENLRHSFGQTEALKDLSFNVPAGQLFALLGPNGSGKSTLFRLISTLAPVQAGSISVFGFDVARQQSQVRRKIGVIFQNPALDKQLTVMENLACHASLYGLGTAAWRPRAEVLLERFDLLARSGKIINTFSGGMRRKVELVKALLTEPAMLILDEPSTGLDLPSRLEMWKLLDQARQRSGLTVIVTTHLMDEADRCDGVAIIDRGRLLKIGSPAELKREIGGDVITFSGPDTEQLKTMVEQKLRVKVKQVNQSLRLEREHAHQFVPHLIEAVPGMIDSVSVGRPTLDDVFIHHTGRHITGP
ncbi:MAG: ABC transporter ATP-binding protein [Burkholderiales bacterium]|nr:ABC transporter ATP-binding protein [Phycisphaerae bacterium]